MSVSAYHDTAPCGLGEYLPGTDDDGNLINQQYAGAIRSFQVTIGGFKFVKKCVLVRNNSGVTLYGKKCVVLEKTAGTFALRSTAGYSTTLHQTLVRPIDDALTSVADKNLFWVVLSGPNTCSTSYVGTQMNSDIAVGDSLCASTSATTTGNSQSGRVAKPALANATDAAGALAAADGLIGAALSAKTTANTDADILVAVYDRLW